MTPTNEVFIYVPNHEDVKLFSLNLTPFYHELKKNTIFNNERKLKIIPCYSNLTKQTFAHTGDGFFNRLKIKS